jgi:hypothetical protein
VTSPWTLELILAHPASRRSLALGRRDLTG